MVGYIYLTTDTTNGMQYVGQHHYNKEGELDSNYHGSGVIIKNIYKKRPETLKEEYIKTCYSEEEMNNDEKYYIKLYDTLWPNGYNLEEGGRGGVPSEETRKKLSEALKGKHHSEETKQKMRESQSGEKNHMFGKHLSDETKRKLSLAHKGKPSNKKGIPLSEETRRKISENHCDCSGEKSPFYGKHHSEESKRKLSLTHKGKHLSEETKKKISESQSGEKNHFFGKHHSEESKKKMSELKSGEKHPMFGKHHSEETKQKMRDAHKKRKLLKQLQPDGCLPLW